MFVGVRSVNNLLIIKAVIKGIELASGLKMIFLKICLFFVNVDKLFFGGTEDYLNCKVVLVSVSISKFWWV